MKMARNGTMVKALSVVLLALFGLVTTVNVWKINNIGTNTTNSAVSTPIHLLNCGLISEYANETIVNKYSQISSIINGENSNDLSIYTIGVLYYCEPNQLKFHVESWLLWRLTLRSAISFVILDDGSPHPSCSAAEVIRSMDIDTSSRFDLQVHRINEDITWNIGGARNLLMTISPTEFVIFLDTDTHITHSLARNIAYLVSNHCGDMNWMMYQFPRVFAHNTSKKLGPHPAVTLISKTLYWQIGGCDEDFVGNYGQTDPHFRWRAARTKESKGIIIASGLNAKRNKSNRKEKIGLPPLILYDSNLKIRETVKRPKLVKNTTHNAILYAKKKSGEVPWSKQQLRFTWNRTY